MPVEECDDSFRVPSEMIVAIPESLCGVFDPEQFLVLA
jgi:hypothetical protein